MTDLLSDIRLLTTKPQFQTLHPAIFPPQIVNLIESHDDDSRPKPSYHVNGVDIDLDSRRMVNENDRVLTNEHSR